MPKKEKGGQIHDLIARLNENINWTCKLKNMDVRVNWFTNEEVIRKMEEVLRNIALFAARLGKTLPQLSSR